MKGSPTTGSSWSLRGASGWLVSPVLPNTFRFWAFIRRRDECPLGSPVMCCALLSAMDPAGTCIINIHKHEPKGAVDKSCICLHVVWWSKKHLVDIFLIWRKMKHFSKNNGSICTALEGGSHLHVYFFGFVQIITTAILVWKSMLCWSYSLDC